MNIKVVTLRFSIIIPVYNVEKYLGDCLQSIVEQDFDDYEVIIVDDGSTDGSPVIYERFAAKAGPRVRVVKQANLGLLRARRVGIAAAQGDYLWHVDGDDALAPHALRTVSAEIDKANPDLLIIGASNTTKFDHLLPGLLPSKQRRYMADDMNLVRSAFLAGCVPSIWMKIAKRDCVDISRDYAEYGKLQLGEDQLQSLYLLDAARSCCCIRTPLYFYRTNDASITASYRKGQVADYTLVKDAVYHQAESWDEKWPGYGFVKTMLMGYLANGFYDMRKNVDSQHFREQFQDFTETNLYSVAIDYRKSLRAEQRLFYLLLESKHYVLAYWCALACRATTRLIRKVER